MPRRTLLPVAIATAAALAIAGCGGGGSGSSATVASSSSGGKPLVTTAKTDLGSALVDGSGRTLYLFAKDTGPKSTCSGGCAADWPPFTATSMPKAGGGLAGSTVSLVPRADGSRQVAVDGHPLYHFSGDQSAGQLNGQGVDEFGAKWFVVAPSGKAITGSGSASTSSKPSGRGSSY